MALPESSWWQSFGPFIETAVGSAGVLFGRMAWTSFWSARSDDQKQDKEDEKQRRNLLRSIDSRAEVELNRAWGRCDELMRDLDAVRKDRDRGWDLARAWRDVTVVERHARNNLLQITGGAALSDLPSLESLAGTKP